MANKSVILELIVQDKNSGKVTNNLRKQFSGVERSIEGADEAIADLAAGNARLARAGGQAAKMQRRMAGSAKHMRGAISGANQTLFSFGDIVNDAQQFQVGFAAGSRAIGNNIGFMAEQFSNVASRAGGFSGALKAMGASLMGPGGIILGINLAVTAVSLFGDQLFGAKKDVEDIKEEIEELTKVVEGLSDALAERGFFGEDPFNVGRLEFELQAVNKLLSQLKQGQTVLLEQDKERLRTLELQQAQYGDLTNTEQQELRLLRERREEAERQQKFIEQLKKDEQQITLELQKQRIIQGKIQQFDQFRRNRQSIFDLRQQQQGTPIAPGRPTVPGQQRPGDIITAAGTNFSEMSPAMQRIVGLWGDLTGEIEASSRAIQDNIEGWEKIETSADDAGDAGQQSMQAASKAANILGTGLAQAAIQGQKLENVFENIAAQLASRAIITALQFLIPGTGAVAGKTSFFGKLFSFAHGTDMGFPGVGMVGERGKELVVAPPMSSVITNENVEALARMKEDASSGAAKLSSVGNQGISNSIKEAVQEGLREATLPTPVLSLSSLKKGLTDFDELQERIGNG